MTQKGLGRISSILGQAVDSFFVSDTSWLNRWLSGIWLASLFIIGLVNWGTFFNWGNLPLDLADWADITTPRLYTLAEAAQRALLPLHVTGPNLMKGVTDRFLVIPDIILSPQIILLRSLQPGTFLLVNLLLLYSVGYAGLLLFKNRYQINLLIFSCLFLLFNFNGHIVAHLAIGHATWMTCFLIPYFILLILQLFEKDCGWNWVLKTASLHLLIMLQGGYHFLVWDLFFLVVLGLFAPRLRKITWTASLASVLINAFRIIPAALVSSSINLSFLGGFTTLNELLRGLVVLIEPREIFELFSPLNPYVAWWEFDYYLGWAGALLILASIYFGIRKAGIRVPAWNKIVFPGLVMAVFSIGRLYKPIFMSNIPLLNSERVSSRFLILPLLFAVFIAAIYAQRLLEQNKPKAFSKLGLFSLFLILFNDLQQHMELWSPKHLQTVIQSSELDPSLSVINNHPDPSYITFLIIGGLISILTIIILLWVRGSKAGKIIEFLER